MRQSQHRSAARQGDISSQCGYYGICGLFVREPLGRLQDGTQGEACGVFTWLAGMGEEVLNVGVVEQRPEGIAQQQIASALGKGGFGHFMRLAAWLADTPH